MRGTTILTLQPNLITVSQYESELEGEDLLFKEIDGQKIKLNNQWKIPIKDNLLIIKDINFD